MTFEEWYAQEFPDLNPECDDFYEILEKAFIAGFDFSADTFDTYTFDEVLSYMEVVENEDQGI